MNARAKAVMKFQNSLFINQIHVMSQQKKGKVVAYKGLQGKGGELKAELLERGKNVIRAIVHPTRQKMIELLNGKEMTVTELYTKLRLEQSVASQMLAILRRAGLVQTRREGKEIYYSVNATNFDLVKVALDYFPQ